MTCGEDPRAGGGDPRPGTAPPTDEPPEDLPGLTAQVLSLQGTVTTLRARLTAVETLCEMIARTLDQFAELGPEPTADEPGDPAGSAPKTDPGSAPEPGTLVFDPRVTIEWVRETVAGVVERHLPASRDPHWCAQWWRHPEALSRFESTRLAWLDAVGDPGAGMAAYWERLEIQLAVLMGENGPFRACTPAQHSPDRRYLPHRDPDERFYREFAQALAQRRPPRTPPTAADEAPVDEPRARDDDRPPATGGGLGVLSGAHRRDRGPRQGSGQVGHNTSRGRR